MKTMSQLTVSSAMTVAVALLLSACSNEERTPDPVSVLRDSAGVVIVENRTAANVDLATWSLSDQPLAVIGAREDEPGHDFTEVVGAFRLNDERIVVGDRGSSEVRFFDEGGRHLRSVGGQGEGPGEFRILVALDRVPGDTVVAGAWPLGLRVWWDSRGEYIANTRSGQWGPGLVGGRTLADGTFLIDVYDGGSYGNSLELWAATGEELTFRTEGVLLRTTRDGEPGDTIAPVIGEEWFRSGVTQGNRVLHASPYTYRTHLAHTDEHIFLGESHEGEVRAYTFDGRLVRVIRWEQEHTPVTSGDRRAFRSEVLADVNNPTRTPNFERWLSEVTYPESKPAFRGFETDRAGRLWVQAWTANEAVDRWLVFERDGMLTATLAAPSSARLLDAGEDYVLVANRDELDVDTVQLFELLRD